MRLAQHRQYDTTWVLTDPDTEQYGRKISDEIYEFKQGGVQRKINLRNYDEEQLAEYISTYGYTFESLYQHSHDPNWVIAECIFETDFLPAEIVGTK